MRPAARRSPERSASSMTRWWKWRARARVRPSKSRRSGARSSGGVSRRFLKSPPTTEWGDAMERKKKASDFPPEVLKLFDGYVHGMINRRDFLDRAAKFAVGGFTAAAMLESLRPNYAFAQQVP